MGKALRSTSFLANQVDGATIAYRGGSLATLRPNGGIIAHTAMDVTGADWISTPEHSIILVETDVSLSETWESKPTPRRHWKAGDLKFLPAGTRLSSSDPSAPYTETILRIPHRLLRAATQTEVDATDLVFTAAPAESVFGITSAFVRLIRSVNPPPLLVEAMTASIVIGAFSAMTEPHSKLLGGQLSHGKLRKAREYIEDNLTRPITLEEIASSASMSAYHFTRSFKAAVGCSPVKYVWGLRVERAKRLLNTTMMPLADVALASGFSGQSHFTTMFRKITGVTPAAWRRGN